MLSEPKPCAECGERFSAGNLREVVGLNDRWSDERVGLCLCCTAKALSEERLEPSRESRLALAELVRDGLLDRGPQATNGDRISRRKAIWVLSCPARQRRWLMCLVGRSVA